MVNILEKYIETRGQLIIAISGFPGSDKNEIGKQLSDDLGFKLIKLIDYIKENYNNIITIDNIKLNNYDTFEYYDWNKFNIEIDKNKKGIIIVGVGFPTDKINFNIDCTIMIRAPKQLLFEIRHDYMVKHIEKLGDIAKIIDTPDEKKIFNSTVYPFYLNMPRYMKVDYYCNITEKNQHIYDNIIEFIINFISASLYKARTDVKFDKQMNEYIYI